MGTESTALNEMVQFGIKTPLNYKVILPQQLVHSLNRMENSWLDGMRSWKVVECPKVPLYMVWNNAQAAIEAVEDGHRVVMANTTHLFLDYYQSTFPMNPRQLVDLSLSMMGS